MITPYKPSFTIDTEKYQLKSTYQDVSMWVPELHLQESDREALLSCTAWLSDSVINAAQLLLKKANSAVSGLQDVLLGPVGGFTAEPVEFVQILNTRDKATGMLFPPWSKSQTSIRL